MSAVHYAFQIHELVSLGIEEIIFVVVEQAIHSRGALHIIDIVSEIIDLETGIASMGFSIRCWKWIGETLISHCGVLEHMRIAFLNQSDGFVKFFLKVKFLFSSWS